jgi:hypothetical protein
MSDLLLVADGEVSQALSPWEAQVLLESDREGEFLPLHRPVVLVECPKHGWQEVVGGLCSVCFATWLDVEEDEWPCDYCDGSEADCVVCSWDTEQVPLAELMFDERVIK